MAPPTGSIDPLPGFLETLRSLCDTHGAVLIFDEILTGFRHALGGGQEMLGVVPDLAAFGKALSNGYPIAALCGRADLLRHLSPSGRAFFSGTYNGNIISVVAALEPSSDYGTAGIPAHSSPGRTSSCRLGRGIRTRNVTAHAGCRGSMVAHPLQRAAAEQLWRRDAAPRHVVLAAADGAFVRARRLPETAKSPPVCHIRRS